MHKLILFGWRLGRSQNYSIVKEKKGCQSPVTISLVRCWAIVFFLAVFLIRFSEAAVADPKNTQNKIRIGVPSPSLSYLPIDVAVEKGFFKKRGIDVQYIQMPAQIAVPALLNQEIDYATVPAPAAIAAAKGAPLRVISFTAVKLQHTLIARPEIVSMAELTEKKIGIGRIGSLVAFEAQLLIEKYRLGPKTTMVSLGQDYGLYISMVKSGVVHCAIVPTPYNVLAEEAGLKRLLEIGDVLQIPQVGLATSVDKLRRKHAEVIEVLKAMIEGLMYTRTHRDETASVIIKRIKLNPALAIKAYDSVRETFSRYGVPSQEQVSAYLAMLRATTDLPESTSASAIFDFSLAEQAATEMGIKEQR